MSIDGENLCNYSDKKSHYLPSLVKNNKRERHIT